MSGLLATLILFLPTEHGLYVAADSRHDGGEPALIDEARKVFLCGPRSVCAISGALRLTVTKKDGSQGEIDLEGDLQRIARSAPESGATAHVAREMHERIGEFWKAHMSEPLNQPLSRRLQAPSVCTILVAAREAGAAKLDQIQFPFLERPNEDGTWTHELQAPAVHPADPKRPLAQGRTDCMKITADTPPLIETRQETLGTIAGLFQRTQSDYYCRSIIGGPIDIAIIEEDGSKWLRRKGLQVARRHSALAQDPRPR